MSQGRAEAVGVVEDGEGEEMKNLPIPKAIYPCNYCADDFSWPPEDLRWSEKIEAWVCSMCWDDDTHGEPKQTLAEVLSENEKK